MQSFIKAALPANLHCQFIGFTDIKLSTAIFIPRTYKTDLRKHTAAGAKILAKCYIRIEFTIPASTPINKLFDTAYSAYLLATKSIRIDIAKHKLLLQKQHLKALKRI